MVRNDQNDYRLGVYTNTNLDLIAHNLKKIENIQQLIDESIDTIKSDVQTAIDAGYSIDEIKQAMDLKPVECSNEIATKLVSQISEIVIKLNMPIEFYEK